MVKKLLKGFLWLVGQVLAVGLGLMAYFFIMGRDIAPSDDSDLRIDESPVPDSENTYVAFLSVTNLGMVTYEDVRFCTAYCQWRRDGLTNKLNRRCGTGAENVRAEVDRILAAHAPYFEGLRRAVALPGYRFVQEGSEWGLHTATPVTEMMQANTLWQTKAMREMDRRDYAAALGTLCDYLAFGRKASDHAANCVQLMVGIAIADNAYKTAWYMAVCEGVPEDFQAALADMVQDEIDMRADFVRAVKGEYMKVSDALRDNEIEIAQFLSLSPGEFRRAQWCCWIPGYQRFSLQPGATRQFYADAFRLMLKGENTEKFFADQVSVLRPNWAGRLLFQTNVPMNLERFVEGQLLDGRFAQVMIAVHRYRIRQGADPMTLEELVPQYLEVVPRDPYAPGQDIQYDCARRIAWSVGEDGDFNPSVEKNDSIDKFKSDRFKYTLWLDGKPPGRHRQKEGGME